MRSAKPTTIRLIAAILVAGFIIQSDALSAEDSTALELKVKAAFLLNFARFIEWPPASLPEAQAPIVIGVLGSDPFGPTLDNVLAGQQVRGRLLEVHRSRRPEDLPPCHILFISSSMKKRIREILGKVAPSGVLTVSEVDGFTDMGGVINFTIEDRRVRFQINQDAAERASLKISSKLLRLAASVTPSTQGRSS